MGGGDWNDGMNRVGHEGKGESVWLAWFLGYVLTRFAPICEARGDAERAADYRRVGGAARARRSRTTAGTAPGTGARTSTTARRSARATPRSAASTRSRRRGRSSPASATPSAPRPRSTRVEEKLVRWEDGLIALLTPPFDRMPQDPGYIKGYVPGVRENGGQYTHAALWVVLAYLLQGDGDEAASLLDLINPINHTRTTREA